MVDRPTLDRRATHALEDGHDLPHTAQSERRCARWGLAVILARRPDDALWTTLFLLVWAFGVVEYVNYFVARLAYPVSRWVAAVGEWRVPRLMCDVLTSSRRPPSALTPP